MATLSITPAPSNEVAVSVNSTDVTLSQETTLNVEVTPTPATTVVVDRGVTGASGISGYSGYSGYSGIGTSGYSGYSGYSGLNGTAQSGVSGYSGFSGYSGYSGSGISGYSGYSGSGISGYSGYSGQSIQGASGYSGYSGYSGSGISGYSGYSGSGISGYSGFSGSGVSGFSGISGFSGWSGAVGQSGISGYSGFSGAVGESGISGFSGFSGSGISGYSGWSGISGYSGSGVSGYSGFSGESGYSGSGISGYSGFSGYSGQQGTSINIKGTVANPTLLPLVGNQPNDAYIVESDGDLYVWDGTAWIDVGQIVGPSGASGISGFSGYSGISGYSGESGASGFSGQSGFSGEVGASGLSGFSGASGISGFSGYSGEQGLSGLSGFSGISGFSGWSGEIGASGISGYSGFSGYSGIDGQSGFSGISGYSGQDGASGLSGFSGYSGSGVSGYSGFSGYSGISGYSGATPTGAISGITSISTPEYIDFDINSPYAATATGRLFYDGGDGTLEFGLKGGNVTLPIGQENVVLAYNASASTLTVGQVVAVSGAQGQRPAVVLADADSEPLSAATLGVVMESIASGAEGFVSTFGVIRGVNTNGFTAGDDIYLSQTAGGFTATRPSAPAHTVFLGWVLKVHASSGEIFLNINNGWELNELHNVLITDPVANNSALLYDSAATVWKNQSPSVTLNSILPNQSGYSGYYLISDGASGAYWGSGISGYSGFSGISGYSGFSGAVGASGISGFSGQNGTNGASGISGYSGYSGINATSTSRTVTDFTPTAGQTVFTVSYTVGYLDVYKNGAKLADADVIATNGTSFTIGACAITDVVQAIAYSGINIGVSGYSGYSGYSGLSTGALTYNTFTATASQTTFSTTGTYVSGKIEVFVNGVKYRNGTDVTVTSGTSVVMTTGLSSGDLVDLVYPLA